MKRLPSPALLISMIALVLAVGGGAYAIGASTNKTIRKIVNRQITRRAPRLSVRHAVSAGSADTAKAADSAISADSARTADSAASATSAASAQSLAPPEAVHLIGAPGEPNFENGAGNSLTLTNNPVGFYRDRQCVVHLQGTLSAKSLTGDAAFTLPPAYRPPMWALGPVAVLGSQAGYFEVISESGAFSANAETGPTAIFGLDGVSFRAATC